MMNIEKDIVGLKFGSDLVIDGCSGEINRQALAHYAAEIALVKETFCPVIFTSGGAAAGEAYLDKHGFNKDELGAQELAAIGSDEISKAWKDALREEDMIGAQVLANHNQMRMGSVLMQTLVHGIGNGLVYIINENDQENIFELSRYEKELQSERAKNNIRTKKPGVDNDALASRGMIALKKELEAEGLNDKEVSLVLFTLVGGFKIDDTLLPSIYAHKARYYYDHCGEKSEKGTGGMKYKIKAGFKAARAGVKTCIASPDFDFLDVINGKDCNGNPIGTRVLQ